MAEDERSRALGPDIVKNEENERFIPPELAKSEAHCPSNWFRRSHLWPWDPADVRVLHQTATQGSAMWFLKSKIDCIAYTVYKDYTRRWPHLFPLWSLDHDKDKKIDI